MHFAINYYVLVTALCAAFALVVADEYIDEIQQQCYVTKKVLSCAKYNVFEAIDKFNVHNQNLTGDSTVRLISMRELDDGPPARTVFPKARHLAIDSEFSKITKFFTRQIGKFFSEHGLAIELPDDVMIVEEGRRLRIGHNGNNNNNNNDNDGGGGGFGGGGFQTVRSKKKKELILPVLILFKLFKVKILVALSLIGIFFIKKTILLAAFFLPSIIASIKQHCKMPQQYHVVPYHTEEEHYTHDHEHQGPDVAGISGYGDLWKPHKRRQYSSLYS